MDCPTQSTPEAEATMSVYSHNIKIAPDAYVPDAVLEDVRRRILETLARRKHNQRYADSHERIRTLRHNLYAVNLIMGNTTTGDHVGPATTEQVREAYTTIFKMRKILPEVLSAHGWVRRRIRRVRVWCPPTGAANVT